MFLWTGAFSILEGETMPCLERRCVDVWSHSGVESWTEATVRWLLLPPHRCARVQRFDHRSAPVMLLWALSVTRAVWDVLSHVSEQRVNTSSLLPNQHVPMTHVQWRRFASSGVSLVCWSVVKWRVYMLLKLSFTAVEPQHAGVCVPIYLSWVWCRPSSFSNYS